MRVVIVCGICVERDAISNAVVEQAAMLRELPWVDHIGVITQFTDRDIPADHVRVMTDAWSLLRDPTIADADVVIFHWGIAYNLFDALAVLAADPRVVVHFHNVTPPHLETSGDRIVLERSCDQIELLSFGDGRIWADSAFNVDTLLDYGVEGERITIMPFPIEPPRALSPATPSDVARFLTVGRFVEAKGVDTLIAAWIEATRRRPDAARLRLIYNTAMSDADLIARLRRVLDDIGLAGTVEFCPDATEDELWTAYEWADVVVSPSLHEGLCVPLIEGYHAGCRAIGTDAGNLPNILFAPDPIVPAGDADRLALAITTMIDELRSGRVTPPAAATSLAESFRSSEVRHRLEAELAGRRETASARVR